MPVKRIKQVEFISLLFIADGRGWREMKTGCAVVAKNSSFKRGGKKTGTPVFRATIDFALVRENDECRQVVIGGPQSIRRPRTKRRTSSENVTSIHLANGADVI